MIIQPLPPAPPMLTEDQADDLLEVPGYIRRMVGENCYCERHYICHGHQWIMRQEGWNRQLRGMLLRPPKGESPISRALWRLHQGLRKAWLEFKLDFPEDADELFKLQKHARKESTR